MIHAFIVVSGAHTPLITIARYHVVSIGLLQPCVLPVLPIAVHVTPPSVDHSQSTTVPVLPDNVSVPLPVPSQTLVLPEIDPATETGFTVIVSTEEYIAG